MPSPAPSHPETSHEIKRNRQTPEVVQIRHSTPRIVTIPPGSVHSEENSTEPFENQQQTSFTEESAKETQDMTKQSVEKDIDAIFITEAKMQDQGLDDTENIPFLTEQDNMTETQMISLTWHISMFLLDLKYYFVAQNILMALHNTLTKSYPLSEENHLCHAKVQELLGNLSQKENRPEDAEKWYRKSFRTVTDICIVAENSSLFRDVDNLKGKLLLHFGRLHLQEKSLDLAEDLLCEALDSITECNNIPQKATVLYNMGLLWEQRFEYEVSETLLRNALSISQSWHGIVHPSTADILMALARLLGNPDNRNGYDVKEAIHFLRKTVYIQEKLDGDTDLALATTLYELGRLLKSDNSASSTETAEILRRGYDIRATKLGDDNVLTKESRRLLAQVEIMMELQQSPIGAHTLHKRSTERPFSGMTFREKELTRRRSHTVPYSRRSIGDRSRSASSDTNVQKKGSMKENDYCTSENSYQDTMMSLPASEKILLELDRPKSVQIGKRVKSSSSMHSLEQGFSNFSLSENVNQRMIPFPVAVGVSSQMPDNYSADEVNQESLRAKENKAIGNDSQTGITEPRIDCFGGDIEYDDDEDIPPKHIIAIHQTTNGPKSLYKRCGSSVTGVTSPSRSFSAHSRVPSTGASSHSSLSRRRRQPRPHSSYISNVQAVTYGPNSTIHSLLGPSSASSYSSRGSHHKTAWFHAPQRFTGPNKQILPKHPTSGNSRRTGKARPRSIRSAPPKFRYIPVDSLEERRRPEPTVSFLDAVVVG